ncbi:unnamed protein product [Coffea canephora]|uniref:RWP-RK domain-containing protein n=2 Tax=Coffea TaxID=13442 RepID=A0A068UEW3_COFCA|nr:protein NLP2 [Coffea arabica]CDP06158.1 unnamed protein product [Coffea canephora]
MSALQSRPPNPTLNPYPNPNPNPKAAPLPITKSLTFDQVSKFFSLPLSDAADTLGVCPSVLKKICHENGLVRWPHRKFLSGKSIEQIKEDAARAKNKQLNEVPKDAGQGSDALANSTVSLLAGTGTELQNKTTSSVAEVSKAQSVMQLQGNKNPQIGSPPKLTGLNLTKGTSTNEDEFKYGFPSHGLSTVSYKWWGNSSNSGSKDTPGTAKDETQGNRKSPVNSANGSTLASRTDGQKCENEARESSTDSPGEGVLSSLRKRAATEGHKALKLGAHRRYVMELDQTKRSVLQQIFKSSLPSEWGDDSL